MHMHMHPRGQCAGSVRAVQDTPSQPMAGADGGREAQTGRQQPVDDKYRLHVEVYWLPRSPEHAVDCRQQDFRPYIKPLCRQFILRVSVVQCK
jgi:hypothetical protein